MRNNQREPDFTKPIDVKAFFYNELGACGCSDMEAMIAEVKRFLSWADSGTPAYDTRVYYDKLYNSEGVFYLIAGMMDNANLIEHGTGIRFPWLTSEGIDFLSALNTLDPLAIEEAEGEAYDGLTYMEGRGVKQ